MQRILVPLFTFVWWNRLWHESYVTPGIWHRDYVFKVTGWRTAIIDGYGRGRATVTFCMKKPRQ